MINIEQQNDEPMEDEPMEAEIITDVVFSHRKRVRKYTDLEDRFDLIYKFIEQNYLLLDTKLNEEKGEFEGKLENLKYTDLTLIEELEVKKKQIDYERELGNYKSLKKEIRLFFAKIYDIYANTMHKRYEQDRAFGRYMAMYAEARRTDELTTQTWLSNALDDAYLHEAISAGLIEPKQAEALREKAEKVREINEQKAKEFYEITERLKKEKAKGESKIKKRKGEKLK